MAMEFCKERVLIGLEEEVSEPLPYGAGEGAGEGAVQWAVGLDVFHP